MRMLAHVLLASAALGMTASPAHAKAGATSGMRITVTVPLVCEFRVDLLSAGGGADEARGTSYETCNGIAFYSITATHRQLLSGENVELVTATPS